MTAHNVTVVTADTKTLGTTEDNEPYWYVVKDQFSIDERIAVKGDVHLILADGCNLNAEQGIQVQDEDKNMDNDSPNKLTIYGQMAGTGALTATGAENCAGIGSDYGSDVAAGTITINSGTVTATGGRMSAGIGSALRASHSGVITINGGMVTAKGAARGTGIGTGQSSDGDSRVIITGGIVTAEAGNTWVRGIGITSDAKDNCRDEFSTGENGHAYIIARTTSRDLGIGDQSGKENGRWRGVIDDSNASNKSFQVYGDQTLPTGITIPEGRTLTVPENTTLTIPKDGITLDGTIDVKGKLEVEPNAIIKGKGQITPDEKRLERSDESYKPAAPTPASVTSTLMTLDKLDDVEYSMNGTNWKEEPTFDKLAPEKAYTFYTRYKGRIYQPSEPSEAKLYTAFAAPENPEAHVTIDYAGETVTAHNGYEVSTQDWSDDEDEWGEWSKETSVYPDGWLRVRKAASGNIPVGDASKSVSFHDRPDRPKGLTVTDVSAEGASDGIIKGVDATMEYRREGEDTWKECPDGTLSDLAVGQYVVRYKATNENFASENAKINVGVVSQTATFCLNDGSITIREENGRIVVKQKGKEDVPIAGNDIRITGNGEFCGNWIEVDGVTTDVNVTLANVQMVDSGEIGVSSADNANVTFSLEGENHLRGRGLIIVSGNVIIDGLGSLTIGSNETPCEFGALIYPDDTGSLTVNGGTIDIYADYADILLATEETSLTVNGGILRSHTENDYAVYVGGAVAINGGTIELANTITSEKDVTVTGGSVTSGEIKPAPTDGTAPVYQTMVTGLGTSTVDALLLKQGDAVYEYGLPAETTTDGELSLYLPAGDYDGAAIIGGKLFSFAATSRESGETSSKATDTGISFDCPEDSRPTINQDGTVTLPGGSTIYKADGETITMPQDGGVFNPKDGSFTPSITNYTVTVNPGNGGTVSGSGNFASGETATVTATPNSGYKFVRWEENGKEVSTDATYSFTVTANRNLTAIFASTGGGGSVTPSYHALTFDTNGGSAIDKLRVQSGKTIDLSKYVPTREGYDFDGWYRDEALTEKIATVKLSRNTTIYAGWTQQEPEPAPSVSDIFIDVAPDAWYVDAVQFAYDQGIMTGTSATTFSPALTTTRGTIVAILHRLEGSPATSGDRFIDVATGDWYAEAVNWAASEGIVSGMSATTFAPNAPITREQLAAIIYNYADYKGMDVSKRADLSKYSDAARVSEWAEDVLSWANAEGLINGMTDTTLVPQEHATRGQVAAIFQRFLSK